MPPCETTWIKKNLVQTLRNSLEYAHPKIPQENDNGLKLSRQDGCRSKWLINLTNQKIPKEVLDLACLGKNFGIPCRNNRFPLERLMTILELEIINLSDEEKIDVRSAYTEVIKNYCRTGNATCELSWKIRVTSKFIKENPEIIFLKADKGNVTVVVDREFYISKMMILLNDTYTYRPIQCDPTSYLQSRVNKLVKIWFKDGLISSHDKYHLQSRDGVIARAYGLPKIHKPNVPFRIIVSFLNTPTYKLAQYLQKILAKTLKHPSPGASTKALKKNKFTTQNSLELKRNIINSKLPADYIMISMDVVSLFTNVPLQLVKEGIKKRWSIIKRYTDIDCNSFIEAVELCFTSSSFLFNNNYYQQIFGAAMGSPLSPIAADMVMEDLEDECLSELAPHVYLYTRFVDDILVFLPKDKVELILKVFNGYHNRLQFTVERESDSRINFLELTLIRNETGGIEFDWYKKPTSSGRYLNYLSHHHLMQKIGVIRNLVDKAILLSDNKYHNKNLAYVRQSLLNNNYPMKLIKTIVSKRVVSLMHRKGRITEENNYTCRNSSSVIRNNYFDKKIDNFDKKYICLPYVKHLSESLEIALRKFDIRLTFKNNNNLSWLFCGHKDRLTIYNKSCVVYSIPCCECNFVFVSHTKYLLNTVLRKHWFQLNYPYAISVETPLTRHAFGCKHYFDFGKTKILATEPVAKVRDYLAKVYRAKLNYKYNN
ncbi:uncharacterized protein LOC130667978 [Microplitis mediator]|uniref:uncharacterized protein LOC130667978 n=1 Tax=Microplitis mediator TaxID=375433 RepID=UPI00255680D2|nr:uncharacterized protein LOC130667978 [Microplitis mediator]